MKKIFILLLMSLFAGVALFISCKKEYSCEGCINGNKPPIANAGPDQAITLPTDSALLDGTVSSDPDGTISSFLWTKISGPASFIINNASASGTVVKSLTAGVYQFELKVKDNGGLSAKDTVQIIVNDLTNPNNRPPVANAGADQTIALPTNTVNLDGSGSTDPDNDIASYEWTKISGPPSFNITNGSATQTQVTNLVQGIYLFELKVTDAGGLFSKDTVVINVNSTGNGPPVANAGSDQTITLPTNMVTLNGSGSTDPDNNITNYSWTKISGPSSFNISNANAVQTQVTILAQGVYQFELKVADVGGLSSKDTIQVTVNGAVVTYTCGDTNRLHINASLTEVGTISVIRTGMAVASANNKILFAGGGYHYNNVFTTRVDVYDVTANSWSTTELSAPRFDIAAVSSGNKIFLAGGDNTDGSMPQDNVDVYDASTNSWSLMHLSRPDECIAAAAVGNKILFAGGCYNSRTVDIYNVTNNTWSTATLPADMAGATGVTAGNKVYFGGGSCTTSIVYDDATGSWSTFPLIQAKTYMAGINMGNKIYWAGGKCDTVLYCTVETQDLISGGITQQTLSAPGVFWKNGGQNVVVKDGKIIFYRSTMWFNNYANKFDIYEILTGTWSIGVLPFRLEAPSIISVNNVVYLAGGLVNGVLSNKVWKLEF